MSAQDTPASSSYEPPADLKERLAKSYDILALTYNTWAVSHTALRIKWVEKLLDLIKPSANTNSSSESVSASASATTITSPQSSGNDGSSPSPSSFPPRILELGAGAGLPTTKLLLDHNAAFHVVANDISPVQITSLLANLSSPSYTARLSVQQGDMLTALDIPTGSLTAVVAMYSIIHLPRDEQSLMLGKIGAWLKPGGLLLANFAEYAAQEHVMEDWLGKKGAWTYWSGWGTEGTLEKIVGAGFEVVDKDVEGEAVDSNFLWVLARKV